MLKQIFQTDVVPYRLPWGGAAVYNPFLTTPPRIYAETIIGAQMIGMGVFPGDNNGSGPSTIKLISFTQQIYYPSYDIRVWTFDGNTGKAIDNVPLGAGYVNYWYGISQNADGSLWQVSITGLFKQLDPATLLAVVDSTRSLTDFGVSGNAAAVIGDVVNDLVLIAPDGGNTLRVHTLSSGALLRVINLAGVAVSVAGEDSTRCFVLTANGILHLIDYAAGIVINTMRAGPAGTSKAICWDRFYRRLLWLDLQTDATDGASQARIRGVYPVPLATKLTTPIPIQPPRAHRATRVALRAIGDCGEPIAGLVPAVVVTGAATMTRAPSGGDATGYSVAELAPSAAGSADVSATLTIDDGL